MGREKVEEEALMEKGKVIWLWAKCKGKRVGKGEWNTEKRLRKTRKTDKKLKKLKE